MTQYSHGGKNNMLVFLGLFLTFLFGNAPLVVCMVFLAGAVIGLFAVFIYFGLSSRKKKRLKSEADEIQKEVVIASSEYKEQNDYYLKIESKVNKLREKKNIFTDYLNEQLNKKAVSSTAPQRSTRQPVKADPVKSQKDIENEKIQAKILSVLEEHGWLDGDQLALYTGTTPQRAVNLTYKLLAEGKARRIVEKGKSYYGI